jgi:hypothetical protein
VPVVVRVVPAARVKAMALVLTVRL